MRTRFSTNVTCKKAKRALLLPVCTKRAYLNWSCDVKFDTFIVLFPPWISPDVIPMFGVGRLLPQSRASQVGLIRRPANCTNIAKATERYQGWFSSPICIASWRSSWKWCNLEIIARSKTLMLCLFIKALDARLRWVITSKYGVVLLHPEICCPLAGNGEVIHRI